MAVRSKQLQLGQDLPMRIADLLLHQLVDEMAHIQFPLSDHPLALFPLAIQRNFNAVVRVENLRVVV